MRVIISYMSQVLLVMSIITAASPLHVLADNKTAPKTKASGDLEASLKAAKLEFEKDDEGKIITVMFGSAEASAISTASIRLVAKIGTVKTLGSKLSDDHISTEELAAIAGIKTIETLKFDCCKFKGSDLKKLQTLLNLTVIDWTDSQIDDDGFRGLSLIKNLSVLKLRGNQVTDTGLKAFSKSKTLTELNLDKTKDDIYIEKTGLITDDGLVALKPLKQLKSLSLRRNAITDNGLKHLAELKELKELDLALNQVTDGGIAKLQAALPDCKINTKE